MEEDILGLMWQERQVQTQEVEEAQLTKQAQEAPRPHCGQLQTPWLVEVGILGQGSGILEYWDMTGEDCLEQAEEEVLEGLHSG